MAFGACPAGQPRWGTVADWYPSNCPLRIHLPASLGSTGIAPLQRYYGRSDSCAVGSLGHRPDRRSLCRAGLPDSRTPPSRHSVANHPISSCVAYSLPEARSAPASVWPVGLRSFDRWLDKISGRITFVILRTGTSPPVASHPASRRRSYTRLRGRRAYAPERTCTSLMVCAFGRTTAQAMLALWKAGAMLQHSSLAL